MSQIGIIGLLLVVLFLLLGVVVQRLLLTA